MGLYSFKCDGRLGGLTSSDFITLNTIKTSVILSFKNQS